MLLLIRLKKEDSGHQKIANAMLYVMDILLFLAQLCDKTACFNGKSQRIRFHSTVITHKRCIFNSTFSDRHDICSIIHLQDISWDLFTKVVIYVSRATM